MPKKKPETDYAAELEKDHARWENLYTNGGSDPFYTDGTNLALVRNHIFNDRRHIEETMEPKDYPPIYFKEPPPEVDRGYMARTDEIRAAARQSLCIYKAHPDYQYIRHHREDFTPKTQGQLYIGSTLGLVSGLESAIREDDLVHMRRHEHANHYTDSFINCAQRMCDAPQEEVQLSLFNL
jgi:hypothetical protein